MGEQNWEYCELRVTSRSEFDKLFRPSTGWSFDCFIRFYVFDGDSINTQLTEIGKVLPYNPFAKAMAFLGANGWELVSIQVGNAYGGSVPHNEDVLVWGNRIAFLKRSIAPGRKVDEPELKF